MTSKTVPRICDFCAKDIISEKSYRAQISERTKKGEYDESTMVQYDRDADMCHSCLLEIRKNGFDATLKQLVKPDHGGKWITKEIRAAKRADEKRNELEKGSIGNNQTLTTGST